MDTLQQKTLRILSPSEIKIKTYHERKMESQIVEKYQTLRW